ncbi:hypothetical protein GHT07_06060 [Caenimonas koreensis DSM 17982]|uniref:Uncharacterized protein n=1 Tax=Caenimonas koreensis DSM 17982 TaxID=1121255 RepID=A0A844B8H9_9BURK|nr:hypothetical protein [Caenimonas koreensis]MRD46831.1 hypothetical protein [Caenimonas koreensis DSM 17982]
MTRKRAAHFVSWPYLVNNPSNQTLISALLELGYDVDVFTSDPALKLDQYGPRVTPRFAQYSYRWLLRNLLHPRWMGYQLFSGTTEEPMAAAGLLARIYRGRCITLADEIKSGSTSGQRSARWKALCRFGMRASNLTIVNTVERIEIQREYAGLASSHPIAVMPNSFVTPPAPGDRAVLRRERGIPEDALVVCYSGVFSLGNGAVWFAQALAQQRDAWFWGQVVPQDAIAGALLPWLDGRERLVIEPGPLGWTFPSVSMAAADVGVVVYLQDAPQFLNMGIASTRLCMFLSMGVPVIASRQPSFQFIEDYDCGVLVGSADEFVAAIDTIRLRLPAMRANALRCAREYIDAPGHYRKLVDAIASHCST